MRFLNGMALLTLGICSSVSICVPDAVRADDKTVTLKRTVKEKQVREYKAESSATINAMEAVLMQTLKETVEKIKDNGEVTLKTEPSDIKLTVGGAEQAAPTFSSSHTTRDKFGKLLDYKPDMADEEVFSLSIQKLREMVTGLILPKNAVKENESWETELNDPAAKDKKFKVKTQYQGMEQVDGAAVWKIKQTAEPDTDETGATMSIEATFWLDPKDGSLIKAEETLKDIPTTGELGKLTIKDVVKAVKPEKAAKDAK